MGVDPQPGPPQIGWHSGSVVKAIALQQKRYLLVNMGFLLQSKDQSVSRL